MERGDSGGGLVGTCWELWQAARFKVELVAGYLQKERGVWPFIVLDKLSLKFLDFLFS